MPCGLDPGASVAVPDKLSDGLVYFWPPVVAGDKFIGGSTARMASSRVVMARFQDFEVDLGVVRNI